MGKTARLQEGFAGAATGSRVEQLGCCFGTDLGYRSVLMEASTRTAVVNRATKFEDSDQSNQQNYLQLCTIDVPLLSISFVDSPYVQGTFKGT